MRAVDKAIRSWAIKAAEAAVAYGNSGAERTAMVDLRQAINDLTQDHTQGVVAAKSRAEYAFCVVDPVAMPEEPSKRNRLLLLALSLFFGLAFADLWAIVRESC